MTPQDGRARPRRRGPNVTGEPREQLRAMLAAEYDTGLSIRDLCREHGLSYGLTRTLLAEAGVKFRHLYSRSRKR